MKYLLSIAMSLLLISVSNIVTCQVVNYVGMHTDATIDNISINQTFATGSTPGQSSAQSGAAGYNIPLAMPMGTGGVVPELEISYSSMGNSSMFGYGWGMAGLSSINRVGQSRYYDNNVTAVQFSASDRFAKDGNRMILMTGSSGSSGSIYSFEAEDYSRITAYGGTAGDPSYFIMEAKNGVKYEYGKEYNSRHENADGKAICWHISKMIYPDGNYISYRYKNSHILPGGSTVLEHTIDEVHFTGNDIAGINPYAKVKFNYLSRTDKNKLYQSGMMVDKNLLVTSIEISTETQTVKTYDFAYGYRKGISFLHAIRERGADGSFLNATNFKYGDDPSGNETHMSFVPINTNDSYFPANTNGDGQNDMVYARKNSINPQYADYFHGYSNTNYIVNLPAESRVVSVADVNGDNLDDVVALVIGEIEILGFPFPSYELKVHYNSDPNGLLDYNESFILYPNDVDPVDGLFYENEHIQPVYSGDYNGDGLTDFLLISNTRVFISYGQRTMHNFLGPWQSVTLGTSSFTNLSNWGANVEKLSIMDFNGDGKSDIFVINGPQIGVFDFETNTQMQELFFNDGAALPIADRLFDQEHLTFFGDFNGDGKTDVLKKVGDENSDPWYIHTSTGIEFNTLPFDFVRNPSIEQPGFDSYFGDVISVGDYNGDGKSDILQLGKITNVGTYSDVYYSNGYNFDAPQYEAHAGIIFALTYSGPTYGGIDGRARTMYRVYQPAYDPLEVGVGLKAKENHLVKIKNGELHTTIFDYKLMTEKLGVNDDFYERGTMTNAVGLVSNFQAPIWLVKDYKIQDGRTLGNNFADDGMKVQSMKYANAKLHRRGKGMIGYGRTEMEDKWSYLRSKTYNSTNETYGILLPDSVVTEFVTGADFTKSTTTHSITAIGSSRYLMKASSMVMDNYHENRKTEQNFILYDSYANPEIIQTIQSTGTPSTMVETKTVATVYGAYGATFPDKPTQISTALIRTGSADYSSTASLTYNTKGQVTSKREFAGQPKEVHTQYEYYNHGGVFKVTKNANGLENQIMHHYYEPKGRYVNEKRNIFGNIVYTASYDVRWGKPLSVTDEAQLTTSFTYDSWGRPMTSTSPQGIVSSVTYNWESTHGVKSETSTSPSRPTTKSWYDQMGRTRRTETQGFNGETIIQTTNYDLVGNPNQSTAPYKSGESVLTTTHQYGAAYTAQRIFSTTTNVAAFGTTSYNYTYNQGKETVTITSPDGKTKSSTTDAAGKVLQTVDNNGTVLDFTYYSHGGLKDVKQGSTTLVTIEYDAYNRKKKQIDISAGTTEYEHDAFGRLVKEINAKGQVTAMTYDRFDRMLTTVRPEGTTSYEYWSPAEVGKAFKLKKITGFSGEITEIDYDATGRVVSEKITIDGVSHTTTTAYDALDRVSSMTYASGLTVSYEYDAYSYLKRIYSGSTSYATVNTVNGRGQITSYTSGNGKQSGHIYFHGIPTRYQTMDNSFDYKMDWNYLNGNLQKREDQYGNKDTMTYDLLDRLYTWTSSNLIPTVRRDTLHYADNGNIERKTDVGDYTYDATKIYAIREVTNPNGIIRDPQQDIVYNSFLQPISIEEAEYRLEYTYGHHGNRVKSVLKKDGMVIETKYYLGSYEKLVNGTGTHYVQYIDLGGRLVAIIHSQGGSHTPHYTYTDHLGSIVQVTDAAGSVEVTQNFDPWGRRRDAGTWQYIDENLPLNHPVWPYRGYTGHEHMPQFHLINMNGRLYDPELGRMLSPDNVVQDGGYSQNYNRYSYAYNNPLRYTDPDGNEIVSAMIIGAFIAVGSNAVSNTLSHKPFWQGAGQAALIGAASGAISFGVGTFAEKIGNVYLRAAFQAGAHGTWGGVSTYIQGGNFIHGFTSGALSSSLSSLGKEVLKLGPTGMIAVGGISGGLGAELTGGNFWQGFSQGLIVSALNHAIDHATQGSSQGDDPLWDFKDQLAKWKADVKAGKLLSPESINGYITPLENYVLTTSGRTTVTGSDIVNYEGLIGTAVMTAVPIGRALSWVFRARGSYVVYQGLDAAKNVRYVGITSRDAAIRFAEHMNSGTAKSSLYYSTIKGATGLTKIQARILEQSLINQYGLMKNGGQLYNKINSIAPKYWPRYGL